MPESPPRVVMNLLRLFRKYYAVWQLTLHGFLFFKNSGTTGGVPTVSIAILVGFLLLHISERRFGGHEPVDSEYSHDHTHGSIAGGIGAVAMAGHVFLDGVALGVAFQVSSELGFSVFLAILVHAFSDGLNTVSLLIKSGYWSKKAISLLGFDALARISGAALGTYVTFNDQAISIYLAVFAGILIYLSTSHILPEAHARHSSKLTLLSTLAGIALMWFLVATLHGGQAHAHEDETQVKEQISHTNE